MTKISKAQLAAALAPFKVDAILVAGGSPCQQLSKAGASQEGLFGKDSGLFFDMLAVVEALRGLAVKLDVVLWELYENVVPASTHHRELMTSALGLGLPYHLDAADYGWTRRKRLVWTNLMLPSDLHQFVEASSDGGALNVVIPRAVRVLPPLAWVFRDGFTPRFLECASSKERAQNTQKKRINVKSVAAKK